MIIPYRDLSVKNSVLKKELLHAVERVLSHGKIILGPEVEEFEKKVANFCNVKHAVGVNSGTDALYLVFRSLDIGPGDEVITTPLSWIATVNAITLCGATPVFTDISDDLNIDAKRISGAITQKTKAILPVHFAGKLCDMSQINEIADQNDIHVVEDAAQAFGAKINGKTSGSFGIAGCFSMNPMKVFCAYGEAGAITTNNDRLYHKLLSLRYAGTVNREDCHFPSLNGRIDTIQAAMLMVEFNYLKNKIKRLREIAAFYTESLKDIVRCPIDNDSSHTYYSYTIISEKRDNLKDFLNSMGIETKIQHPILMPYHKAYQHLPKYDIPVAERLVNQILCIPNHDKLSNQEIAYIVKKIKEFFGC